MIKLHGSLIFAAGSTISAGNVLDTATDHNGKISFISNMAASHITPNAPTSLTPSAVFGTTTNDDILTGPNAFDSDLNHPNIGELTTGAGTQGILNPSFWNSASVSFPGTDPVELVSLPGDSINNPFDGYDQIFVKNTTASPIEGIYLCIGSNPYVLLPTTPEGTLQPGEIFTTTGVAGLPSSTLVFTGPEDTSIVCDSTATFEITIISGTGPFTFQWEENTGGGFAPMTDENNSSLILDHVPYAYNGYKYRCIVHDAYGTATSNEATLTLLDIALPVPACNPLTISLDATGNYTLSQGDINDIAFGSSDDCGISSLTVDPDTFSCLPYGDNPVTLTVTDVVGKTSQCTTVVTVEDHVPPTPVCNIITVVLDVTSHYTLTPADVDAISAGSSDACGIDTKVVAPDTFDCSNLGPNTVQLTLTDIHGNVSTCDATVNVEDHNPPTAQCTAITITLDDTGNYTLTQANLDTMGAGSTDDCGDVTFSASPDAFTCANVGDTPVTLTVRDESSNESTCPTTVTVQDLTNPQVVCNDITVDLDATGHYTLSSGDIDTISAGSTDACGIASKTVVPDTFDCTNLDANTVTLTITDNNGNSNNCTATVTVRDELAPTAVCTDITVPLVKNVYAITQDDIDAITVASTDNCEIVSRTFTVTEFDCDVPANNTGTVTLTDEKGNTSTCTATVYGTLSINDPDPIEQEKYFTQSCSFEVQGCGGTGIADYVFTWYFDEDGSGPETPQVLNPGNHPNDSSTSVSIVTAGRISTLNLSSLGFGADGSYYCVLNDTSSNTQSEYGVLYVRNNLAITQHPQNTTKNEYETAQFHVVTNDRGGIQPLHYEWKWYHGGSWVTLNNGDHVSGSGSQISGADTDTLSIALSGDGVMDAGNYRVTVSDSGTPTPQSVTSNSASLTVTIHMNGSLPAEIRAYTGEALSITAMIDNGVPPYSFVWSKDGTPIPGAPSTITLDLGTADAGDMGSYTVVVDDTSPANPPIDLGPCVVSVANVPAIVTDLSDVYVYEGAAVEFSVVISGGFLPLVHTWRESSAPMGAPDTATLDLGEVILADNGRMFDVVVVDQGSTISGATTLTSAIATLYVGTPITYTRNPGDFRMYNNEPAFVMDAMFEGGLFPASYEWVRNPAGNPDETSLGVFTEFVEGNSVVLTVNPAGEQGLYDYRVCITDAIDTACSTNGSVEFADHIEFEKPLKDTTIPMNEPYQWSVTVKGGLEPISYGWFKDDGTKAWQDLGVYTSYLDFSAPEAADDGLYRVEVSEADSSFGTGQTITSEATLKVGYSIPVMGMTGLAALAALAGGLGALRIRRKK